jgi:hypothetical protein
MTDEQHSDEPPVSAEADISGSVDPPVWATDLKQTILDLPGKLRAVVTDDDKNSIAESVHGLFERSGAFEKAGESDNEDSPETQADPHDSSPSSQETPPKKTSSLARFASWFEGR